MEKENESKKLSDEKQDSIKIARNSRGYVWECKRYFNYKDTKPETIIQQLERIDQELKEKFGGE